MVKLCTGPTQPAAVGVAVIVPGIGVLPPLVAVNATIVPVPLAAKPIPVSLFVQLYTVPPTEPVNITAVLRAPLQTAWFETAVTLGIGFTMTVSGADVR